MEGVSEHGDAGGHGGKEALVLVLLGAPHLSLPTCPTLKPSKWGYRFHRGNREREGAETRQKWKNPPLFLLLCG